MAKWQINDPTNAPVPGKQKSCENLDKPIQAKLNLTRSQAKWLKKLRKHGFVEAGAWGYGQRNRPLRALVEKGLAIEGMGPKGCTFQVHGFTPVGKYPINEPISETLTGVVNFLGGS